MRNLVTIRVGDQELRAYEVDFDTFREEWNEYKLADGGNVRVKTVVQRIFRVVDDSDQPATTDAGDPHIVVRHNVEIVGRE